MIWNDEMIMRDLMGDSPMAYVPDALANKYGRISEPQIQPASLDVRLGESFLTHPGEKEVDTGPDLHLLLLPGECILGVLLERLRLPSDIVARIEGKSTWARQFLTIHSAGFIDPGFHGDVTLELKNDGRKILRLTPGDLIAQVSFQTLAARAARPYGNEGLGSHYQGQEGATPPWRSF